jgi:NDP-sugar pyrophosphorylase family protein
MDLGTPDSYLDVHEHPEAILDPSHCMRISPTADISPDASIDSFCSIGSGAKIGSGVQLNSCVVWPLAEVPAGTIASRQIFLPNCQ